MLGVVLGASLAAAFFVGHPDDTNAQSSPAWVGLQVKVQSPASPVTSGLQFGLGIGFLLGG